MSLSVTILGCGSSGGVPRVAQGWGQCDPKEPRNRRRRCSILVRRQGAEGITKVLVDTSPDLREQLIGEQIDALDGVVITHDHADHTHGIDDLRPLYIHNRRRIDLWHDPQTSRVLRKRFDYAFEPPEGSEYPPILNEHYIVPGEPTRIGGPGGDISVNAFRLPHGARTQALGLRFGDMAYTPDLNAIPDERLDNLRGLDLWIVDALRIAPHPSHFTLAEALGWIEQLKPRRAVLTNLHTDLDYRTLVASLPQDVVPAYDGLRLNFE
jgi:phosphoribosyl 1,2-cyclic phosphate phosphodiesterase